QEAASASGGRMTKVEFYDPRSGDAAPAIQRLMPGGNAQGTAAPAAGAPPAPAFDALLLPEGGAQLKQIARQVKAAAGDTTPVRRLGSGLWDAPDIGGDPALIGGWFAASPPEARQEFERRYSASYGHNPPRLASLGYDAAALAAVLARGEGADPFAHQA